MNINFFILLATTLINLSLASFIYLKNRKNWINISFSLFILNAAFWTLTNAISLKVGTLESAIFWSQLSYLSVIFLNSIFLYFSLIFPEALSRSKKLGPKKYHKIFIALFIPLMSVVIFIPGFTIETVILHPWKIVTGPGLYFFAAYFFVTMGWSLINLVRKFFISRDRERVQLIYLFWGVTFFGIGGSFFNLILPLLGDYRFVFFGPIFSFIMIGFVGYAIVKQELFEIKVVLTQLLVVLIAILLAVDLFIFTPQFHLQIFKSLALIIFLYFGWLLIKNVKKEIQQREKMEVIAKQLQEANKELNRKSKKLKKTYKELKKLDNMKSSFIAITSHQLRTPLTVIKGYVSMILEEDYGKVPKKIEQPMKNVYQSNERLIGLVNDLLNISKINANKVELELKQTCLEEIIISIIKELQNEAKIRNIFLKFEKPKKILPKVLVDNQKIRQIILNVIDNAIKYTERGEVVVSTSKQGNNYQIKIKDTGIGITREDIYSIFQGFYRGKDSRKTMGTGLGLHIAQKLIKMHGGEIWAESLGKNKGSTFYINLPIK